jgi:hypothetical protein
MMRGGRSAGGFLKATPIVDSAETAYFVGAVWLGGLPAWSRLMVVVDPLGLDPTTVSEEKDEAAVAV